MIVLANTFRRNKYLVMALFVACAIATYSLIVSTRKYGIGVSPDSLVYFSLADNLANGNGFLRFDGIYEVLRAPFYPILLAAFSLFGIPPITSALLVNIACYDLIIILSGILLINILKGNLTVTLSGILFVVCSVPILWVACMAWTELLFISEILAFLHCFYLNHKYASTKYLIYLSLVIAFASITRYLGITLLITLVLYILFDRRDILKAKISKVLISSSISLLPICIWCVRNYSLSGTPFGKRGPSTLQLHDYFEYTGRIIVSWFFPADLITDPKMHYLVISAIFVLYCAYVARVLAKRKTTDESAYPSMLLFIVYSITLIFISSNTNFVLSDYRRYMVPLFVIFIINSMFLFDWIIKKNGGKIGAHIFIIIVALLSNIAPIAYNHIVIQIKSMNGAGSYATRRWVESPMIQYFTNYMHKYPGSNTVYSNSHYALYYVMCLNSVVAETQIVSTPRRNKTEAGLKGKFPADNGYCLMFNNVRRDYMSIEQLENICKVSLIKEFGDGSIYRLEKINDISQ